MTRVYRVSPSPTNSYLVRERDRRRWRELVVVVLTVLPLAVAVLAYTWVRMETLRTGYRIDALERSLNDELRRESELRLEASQLSSPSRVERNAREELGMVVPGLEQMVFVEGPP